MGVRNLRTPHFATSCVVWAELLSFSRLLKKWESGLFFQKNMSGFVDESLEGGCIKVMEYSRICKMFMGPGR